MINKNIVRRLRQISKKYTESLSMRCAIFYYPYLNNREELHAAVTFAHVVMQEYLEYLFLSENATTLPSTENDQHRENNKSNKVKGTER